MDSFDVYAELGVARDASVKEIRAAYIRAAKRTHPDSGTGNAEAFGRCNTAWEVLNDPGRRARFDETGSIDEKELIDGRLSHALTFITEALMGAVVKAANGNDNPRYGPFREQKLIDRLRANVQSRLEDLGNNLAMTAATGKLAASIAPGFSRKTPGANYIGAILENEVAALEREEATIRGRIEAMKYALTLLDEFDYTPGVDQAAPYGHLRISPWANPGSW